MAEEWPVLLGRPSTIGCWPGCSLIAALSEFA
jgi:hypothetical protein